MRLSRRELMTAVSTAAVLSMFMPAFAQEHGAEGEAAPDEAEVARSVDMVGLVFPVFDESRKLKNYIFVNARMLAGPGKDVWKYREQMHFIRDAIVCASHKVSFNVKGDIKKLDEKLAAAECLKAANQAIGEPNALVQMTFTQVASQS